MLLPQGLLIAGLIGLVALGGYFVLQIHLARRVARRLVVDTDYYHEVRRELFRSHQYVSLTSEWIEEVPSKSAYTSKSIWQVELNVFRWLNWPRNVDEAYFQNNL